MISMVQGSLENLPKTFSEFLPLRSLYYKHTVGDLPARGSLQPEAGAMVQRVLMGKVGRMGQG